MKAKGNRLRDKLKVYSVLMAILLSLLSMAAGEKPADSAAAVDGGPVVLGTANKEIITEDVPTGQFPAPLSDVEENAEAAEEEKSDEREETAEDSVPWDGVFRPDVACNISMQGSKLYRFTVPHRSDLILTASGVPVKITITMLQSGQMRIWESTANTETGTFDINAYLTLEKGEYSVNLELLRENQTGKVSVCFSTQKPTEEEPETDMLIDTLASETGDAEPAISEETYSEPAPDAEVPEQDGDSSGTEGAEEAVPAAETGEPDTNITEKNEIPEDIIPEGKTTDETEMSPEKPEADPQPDPAAEEAPEAEPVPGEELHPDAASDDPDSLEPAESAVKPLTIRVVASCEGAIQPGARIVLTAVVSDPDYQGTIRWQYSADGGMTVCDIKDASGTEYSFILDEVNRTYLWRAYLE